MQVERLRHLLAKAEGTCSRLATEKSQVVATLDSLWSEKEQLAAAVATNMPMGEASVSSASPETLSTADKTSLKGHDEERTGNIAALEVSLQKAVQVCVGKEDTA